MKTMTLWGAALGTALTLAACGSAPLPEWVVTSSSCKPTTSSTSSTTSSSTTASSSDTGGQGGAFETTSSSTGGGDAGTGGEQPFPFSATCTGLVDCPMLDDCVQWDYNIVDDGTSSTVTASVTVLLPSPLPPCTGMTTFSNADPDQDSIDTIDVPCGTQTWSLGLDRTTMTVYLKEDPAGLSWTPACQ